MKRIIRLLGIVLLCATLASPLSAQGTPVPETSLGSPGFPQLQIRATESETQIPSSIRAARTIIHFENATDRSLHPLLVRLPEGISTERALDDFGGDTSGPPAWLVDGHFPGFVGETMPGATSWAVIDLVAGDYILVGSTTVSFEVTGSRSIPPAQQTPLVDVSVEVFEYGFKLPREIGEGSQIWSVTNTGDVAHEVLLVWTPDALSPDEMLAALMPSRGEELPEGITPPVAIGGLGWLSPGMTAWTEVDLLPGSYLVLCFVYDPDLRGTHFERDMIDSFTIGVGATPVAASTPAS